MNALKRYCLKHTWIALFPAVFLLSGCFKDFRDEFLFTDFMIEFDDATWNSAAPGLTYPILGPFDKGSGVHTFQVNLIGGLRETDQTLHYRVVEEETSAVEGVHFRLHDGGSFVLAANSTTGIVSVEILDFPAESGTATIVLELVGNDEVKVSENYKKLGLSVSLIGPPSESHGLYGQLGGGNYYNTIAIDILYPNMEADFISRYNQSAAALYNQASGNNPRRQLAGLTFTFIENQEIMATIYYAGGGGTTATNYARAHWFYKFEADADGVGTFVSTRDSLNTGQRTTFAPLIEYFEGKEFKVDWVDAAIASPPRPGKQIGGFFRTDDPSKYFFGTLEQLPRRPLTPPTKASPALHDMFYDVAEGGYFRALYIDPESGSHSQAFRSIWETAKNEVENRNGRVLHSLRLYFNPAQNFNDVQLVLNNFTSNGAQNIGRLRCNFFVDFDGAANLNYVYNVNAIGGEVSTAALVDDYLISKTFIMSRNGDQVTFTDQSNPANYFVGILEHATPGLPFLQ